MSGNVERRGYDVEINSIKYRFRRGEGIVGLTTQKVRNQVELQEITGIGGGRLQSRADVRPFMQTDWSGGSRWEKPLLGNEQPNIYFDGRGLDGYTRPGFLVPINKINTGDQSSFAATNASPVFGGNSASSQTIYWPGNTTIGNGTNHDIYEWDSATETFTRLTNGTYSDTINDDAPNVVYDSASGYFFHWSGNSVWWWEPVGATEGNALGHAAGGQYHFLLVHNGQLMMYDGNILQLCDDPAGTPAWSTIANDGMGKDVLIPANAARVRTPVSTSEGVYYVKTIMEGGYPVPWVFRVELDTTGSWIASPIATLPGNSVATSIAWHLGSLIIGTIRQSDGNQFTSVGSYQTDFYHVSGNSLGLIGTLNGINPTETASQVLGSRGQLLYIGSEDRVWVYDAIRGGLHPYVEYTNPGSAGPFHVFTHGEDSDGDEILMFANDLRYVWLKTDASTELTTVTNFGDDTETYHVESAYFDFGVPFEDKTITAVEIDTEQLTASEQWTLFIEADDAGAWTQVAAHTNADQASYELATPITGKRFRYKLVYETKSASATPGAFRGLRIDGLSGEVTTAWVVEIDGTESRNLENETIDPEDMYDDLNTLADTLAPITFKRFKPNSETEETFDARVARVEFEEDSESEFYARVVLVDKYEGAA